MCGHTCSDNEDLINFMVAVTKYQQKQGITHIIYILHTYLRNN